MQSSNLKIIPDSPTKNYDLAIVGAGVSAAYTLIHYISQLEQKSIAKSPHRPTKIVVTEKSGQFWTGIPYGDRSGHHSLLISPFKEFMPQDAEREHFINWLNTNRDDIFAPHKYQNSPLAAKWLEANATDIAQGLWDNLFIPRYVFGQYIQQHVTNILAAATSKGLIEIDLLTAETIDIQRLENDLYRIESILPSAEHRCFCAQKLVLAIGSPPNIAFAHPESNDPDRLCYIDNMYEPSLDANIARICQSLRASNRPSHRQLLIIGSNAGTLDTLFGLNNSQELTSLVDKFIILSPHGTFPHRINPDVMLPYNPENLISLIATESFTAQEIFAAVDRDVACASAQNINISDIFTDISKAVMNALNLLSYEEQKQFVSIYAVEIGKLQRRAGAEYLDVVNDLIDRGKLEFVKGKFSRYLPLTDGGNGCEYINSETKQPTILDAPIGAIVNCAGFQDVTKSSAILIQNLIRHGICIPNDSKRGFLMDKNYKASKNCYLMGPLVAGNIDGNFKIWHAESCQRIITLSKQLATALIQLESHELPPLVAIGK